jgi:hypothetical protein
MRRGSGRYRVRTCDLTGVIGQDSILHVSGFSRKKLRKFSYLPYNKGVTISHNFLLISFCLF